MKPNLLIVDDEQHTREGLELALEDKFEVFLASNPEEAFNAIEAEKFEVVLTDLRMSGQSGMSVIDFAIQHPTSPICIMMTAYGEVDVAVEAMKRGAFDFLSKPVNLEKLELLIRRGLEGKTLKNENSQLHTRLDKKFTFQGILGKSPALEKVLERIQLVAPSKATVLLTGETCMGKELVANPFIRTVIVPGPSFPYIAPFIIFLKANFSVTRCLHWANEKRIGRFEWATEEPCFWMRSRNRCIDSGCFSLPRNKEYRTLGQFQSIDIDTRLVCATNRDLVSMIRKDEFREDLFYRLNVVTVELPPLRERGEDILLLIDHVLGIYAEENQFDCPKLSKEAVDILKEYSWPGNIRELRNFCENLVVLKGDEITHDNLDAFHDARKRPRNTHKRPLTPFPLRKMKKGFSEMPWRANRNRTKNAELMGISRRTLHRKLSRWPELDLEIREAMALGWIRTSDQVIASHLLCH